MTKFSKRAFLAASLLTFSASASFAEIEFYVGRSFGGQDLSFSSSTESYEYEMVPGYTLGASYLRDYTPQFQWGGDFMTTSQGYGKDSVAALSSTSLSLVGRVIQPINGQFQTYLGAGVGAAQVNWSNALKDHVNAYGAVGQVEAGFRIPYGGVNWFTGLKYQAGLSDFEADELTAEYNNLSLIGGLSF